MKHFGLIGQSLKHSFSKKYFEEKFGATDSLYTYQLYELGTIGEVADLIYNERLSGFNVTIPYKQTILPYIDELSDEALQVGAVNAVKVEHSPMGKPYLKGYNTDVYGFEQSLQPLLNPNHIYALILGTGGASKAVAYVLDKLNIGYKFVSLGKMTDFIKKGDDPNTAWEKASGQYGRVADAVKIIDPRTDEVIG
jgi:shikimate dehydrogenase